VGGLGGGGLGGGLGGGGPGGGLGGGGKLHEIGMLSAADHEGRIWTTKGVSGFIYLFIYLFISGYIELSQAALVLCF
jgi:hypothetical protein